MAIKGSTRRALIGIEIDPSWMDGGLREARGKLKRWQTEIRRNASSAKGMSALGGMLAGAVGGVAAGVTGRAMSFAEDVGRDVLAVEKAMTRLQIAGGATAVEMATFRQRMLEVSTATGVAQRDLVAGAAAYQGLTGDAAGARSSIALFAKVANASGAEMADIAKTAASLRDNLQIDPANFQQAFDILITQGKAGAIELNELSTLLSGLAPSFAAFKGGVGVSGLADLGAAFQITRKGFGSAAEASTGLRAFAVAVQRSADKFKKEGVSIFSTNPKTGKKELRGLFEIVDAIGKSPLANDPTLLTKAFGSDEAKRTYDQLVQNRALLARIAKEGAASDAVNRDSADFLASRAGKIEIAMNRAKTALAEAFTPERIERFADALGKTAELFADIVGAVEFLSGAGDEDAIQSMTEKVALDKAGGANASVAARRAAERGFGLAEGTLGHNLGAFEQMAQRAAEAQGLPVTMLQRIEAGVRKAVADGMARAPAVTLRVGDEAVARSVDNAKSARARTGGR